MSINVHPGSLIPRRQFLTNAWNGIGAFGLAGLLGEDLLAGPVTPANGPLTPQKPHFPRKAKHCIFLFMQGGVSQMDAFENKPLLRELHGKPISGNTSVKGELQGRLSFPHVCVGSPFDFKQYGDSARWMSELFPNMARRVDDMAFVHGIKTDNQNHGPSTYHVNTGSQFPGSPSVGSWIQYGLGTLNQNMPGYIVIQDPRGAPCNGAAVWANGYLPAVHQGTLLRDHGNPILNLHSPANLSTSQQREEFDLIRELNEGHLTHRPWDSELESRIAAYELAFRMQTAAPEAVDLSGEPESIRKLYGLDKEHTRGFGRQCLLARRMVERGVRYSLLIHGVQIGSHSWDDHGNVEGGMRKHSREVDQPVAALLEDLDNRGLLEETLVVWASEMGRTPFVNSLEMPKNPGREHNSYGLCMWMAGGDVKRGATVGETDAFSLRSVGKPIHIRDVHATILDLMGLHDEDLTFRHAGRIRKLTDIGGHVLHDVIG
ncbi:DUF1501 domain-containing protein [Verrucomicrobia bacterium]|nr:DUF1501 domain-containing protein [Verrucomicrobiota bacterium]MDB4778705.1 DUF1501 domain-containing protein [Verrucomicrobiota bacterium]